jgi:hypothetical protein
MNWEEAIIPKEGVVAYLKVLFQYSAGHDVDSNNKHEDIRTDYLSNINITVHTTNLFSPCSLRIWRKIRLTALMKGKTSKSVSMRRSIQHVLCRQHHISIVWYANIISKTQTGRRMTKTQRNAKTFYATTSRGLLLDALSVRKNEDFR